MKNFFMSWRSQEQWSAVPMGLCCSIVLYLVIVMVFPWHLYGAEHSGADQEKEITVRMLLLQVPYQYRSEVRAKRIEEFVIKHMDWRAVPRKKKEVSVESRLLPRPSAGNCNGSRQRTRSTFNYFTFPETEVKPDTKKEAEDENNPG